MYTALIIVLCLVTYTIYIYIYIYMQGYISIGLEERLKYLRRPLKRPQKCASAEGTPPTKRPPKAVMPHSSSVCVTAEREDEDSHQRNVDKLKSFYKQVCECTCHIRQLVWQMFSLSAILLYFRTKLMSANQLQS